MIDAHVGASVTETVSTLEVRQRLGDLLNRVALRQDQFLIVRKRKPLAVLLPVGKLEQMERLVRGRLLEMLDEPRRRRIGQAEAERIADEAKHRSRGKTRSPRRAGRGPSRPRR